MSYVLGIDAGGTFIDFFLVDERGVYFSFKSLAQPDVSDYGVISGLSGLAQDMNLDISSLLEKVNLIVHGTTVATNAVLTRSGANTALLTTEGLIDLLEMRQGVRDDFYNNNLEPPAPLVERWLRIPVRERIDYKGKVIRALDIEHTKENLNWLSKMDIESVAIVLAHSYVNNKHEKILAELVKEYLPQASVSLSHKVLPRAHMYRRVSTTVLDAYVAPILSKYLNNLLQVMRNIGFSGQMLIIQSNGGTVTVDEALQLPVLSLLSGPAAGPNVIRYLSDNIINDAVLMDLGGTSFDVSLIRKGEPGMSDDTRIDGNLLGLPVIDINTIGAGGGSIAWLDSGGLIHIGPSSAGAKPGPACYGIGGELPTCTDADLVLGLINPDYFLGGRFKLDKEKAWNAIDTEIARPLNIEVLSAAQGIFNMVNTDMAAKVKEITLEKGYDPRTMTLVVGGGAGPLHAAYVANQLGITQILILRESSVMCAMGMLCCAYRCDYYHYFYSSIDNLHYTDLHRIYDSICSYAREQAVERKNLDFTKKILHMRYKGQHYELQIEIGDLETLSRNKLIDLFHLKHRQIYGYVSVDPDTEVEVLGMTVSVQGESWQPSSINRESQQGDQLILKGSRRACLEENGVWSEVPVYDGEAVPTGYILYGPALVEQRHSTVVVPSGFTLLCREDNNFFMKQLA